MELLQAGVDCSVFWLGREPIRDEPGPINIPISNSKKAALAKLKLDERKNAMRLSPSP
jgi:hypothetical protein